MKRASYRESVAWVAVNDSAGNADALEIDSVSELITTVMVADLFDVEPSHVAKDVVKFRLREKMKLTQTKVAK